MIETKYSIVCKDHSVWYNYVASLSILTSIWDDLKTNWGGTLQIEYALVGQLEIVFDDRESYMEFVLAWG
jgi:hypothetical protein